MKRSLVLGFESVIVFASIFLGLILGTHTVVVVVSDEVARVEILLDGQVEAVLEDEPWSATFDFGDELVPRELVAIAYDAEDQELARAKQRLNLPKPAAVARLVIDSDSDEPSARLVWESTAGSQPKSARIIFDGESLDVEDLRHFDLPSHDPAQVHFLRAELDFGDGVTSVTEMTFGGAYGANVTTEITAIPITFRGRESDAGSVPSVASLQGLFRKDGELLEVVAVERDGPEVVMVVDWAFGKVFNKLLVHHQRPLVRRGYSTGQPAAALEQMSSLAPLQQGQSLRFLTPESKEKAGVGALFNVFPKSPSIPSSDGGVFFHMGMYFLSRHSPAEQHLSVAVAIAGLAAAGTHRPRAVVIALGEKSEDSSSIPPEITRAYLEALRVPLYVWYPRKKLPEELRGWGQDVVKIASLGNLGGAVRKLSRDLERQWIVWLDGVHLPQTIEIAPGNEDVRLVR